MSVKDVVRNIRTKGILGTYQIYKNRPNYLPRRIYHFIQEKQDQGRFLAYLSNLSKYDLPEIENIDDSLSQERAQCTTEFQKKFEEYEEKMGGRSSTDFYYEEAIQDKTILLLGLNKNIRGNMRYILDELNTNPEFDNYKIYVRTSNETDSSVKECIQENDWMRTSTVKSTGKYDRLLESARFLITEVFFPAGWVKKEGQLYINIWHGTPLKKLGLAKFSNNIHKDGIKQRDFMEADYLLYPNEYAKKNLLGSYKVKDLVEGKIVNLGYPRTGGMLAAAQSDQTDLLEQLAPNHETLYAYMPTWKDYLSEEQVLEETKELLDYLDENLTDDQILYVNLHHKVNDSLDYSAYKRIKRFPATIDNYRLLAMTDALITDYSSVFYDYLALGRQIILYCADFDIYKKRRGVYMDLDELPFDKARTPEEVVDALNRGKTYDDAEAIQRFCAYDTVNNARDLCGLLLGKTGNISLEEIQKNNEKRVLIYWM